MTRLTVLQKSLWLGTLTILLVVQPSPPSYAEESSTKSNQALIPELELIKEEETVSIASRYEQPISQAPANVYVITDEDIRHSGATDIPTILRRVPGLEVMQVTGAEFNARATAGIQRLLEFLIGLPRKSDDDVRREGGAIESFAQAVNLVEKPFDCISPAHAMKHCIRPALQCRMELRTKVLAIGGGSDEVVVNLGCLDAGKPHAPRAGNSIKPAEQMRKSKRRHSRATACRIDAVVADMDSCQDDLAIAISNQTPEFVFNIVGRSAAEAGADLGNDAVRTFQDAAVLHFDIGPLATLEPTDASWHVDDAVASEDIGQFPLVGHDLEHRRQRTDGERIASRVTAHDERTRPRIVLCQLADHLSRPRITV